MRPAIAILSSLIGLATACADSPVAPPAVEPAPATPVTQLLFRVQPADSYAGAPVVRAIEVVALAADGVVASRFAGEITLSVDDSAAGPDGMKTVHASGGVAHFSDVSIHRPGLGYTWRATTGTITAQSLPFDVAPAPRVAFSTCFAWAATSRDETCTEAGIAILGADGSVSALSAIPGRYSWDPAWSPDGKYIAVTGTMGCQWWQDHCDTDLYLINLEDGTERRLTHGEYSSVELPSWSPNGQLIAFSAVPKNEHRGETIYTMSRDGSNVVMLGGLFGVYGVGVVWSPDGNRIAFTVAGVQIWVADADGSHARKVTENAYDSYPAWSPDGRRIAFTRQTIVQGDFDCQIFLTSAEGSPPVQLTRDATCGTGSAWSPDGTKIIYNGSQPALPAVIGGLMVIKADGGDSKVLRQYAGYESRPSWAPAPAAQGHRP